MNFEFGTGFLAGLLTTIAFLPQLWRLIKQKSSDDLSLPMLLIFTAGIGLWFTYGLLKSDVVMIFFNAVTLILALLNVFFCLKYRVKKTRLEKSSLTDTPA